MVTRNSSIVAVAGLAVWAGALVAVPGPLAARIALLAPLIVVPRMLTRLSQRRLGAAASVRRLAGWPAFVAALPLPLALALPAGPVALGISAPWLALAGLFGLAAARDALRDLQGLFRYGSVSRLGTDAALGFLAVGALFLAADRMGFRPLEFPATIVLLTAVHFLVAGFGLMAVLTIGVNAVADGPTGTRSRSPSAGRMAIGGLVIGMPLTAAGFVLAAPLVNWAGSLVVASSGLAAAASLALIARSATGPGRPALVAAAVALAVAMPLAIVYATGTLVGTSTLDLDLMVRTHGALNGTAVLLATLALPSGDPR